MAVMDLQQMRLSLVQLVETSRSYTNTLSFLEAHGVQQLLVVATGADALPGGVNRATRSFQQIPLGRAHFDDTKGATLLAKYCTAESAEQMQGTALHSAYYLALGASGALLGHLEMEKDTFVAASSVHVDFVAPGDYMHIDVASVESLELVRPLQPAGGGSANKNEGSLYGLLNRTRTLCGARLLKANILQPLTSVTAIRLRLESVDELIANDDFVHNVDKCLSKLPKDLDKVCSSFAMRPVKAGGDPIRRISSLVSSMILLRDVLALLPAVSEALHHAESQLLTAIRGTVEHPVFAELQQHVEAVIDEDARTAKSAFISRAQQCFAVKGAVNGFLDVTRSNFCGLTEEIHSLADRYREEHALPHLKMPYAARRGFYLVLPGTKSSNGSEVPPKVPPGWLITETRASSSAVSATTHELNALNSRLKDALSDCLLLTEQVLEELLGTVVRHMATLHKLLDAFALLDLLASFAAFAASATGTYVRPQLAETGPIAVVDGRHPVLEALVERPFQPNDTFMADTSSFHVVGGPNMAGKSTYLRQVALIVIMAQLGCRVPAAFASVRPVDRLFTRICTNDSIETNSSSFMVEMQDTAYIVAHATSRSLVIIDELGRATSTEDGIGIAWAVSEYLIALGCFTLFATHFGRLGELPTMYPNARVWHLELDTGAAGEHLTYTRRLRPGAAEDEHYGLLLAGAIGMPSEVLDEARRVVDLLEERKTDRRSTSIAPRRRRLGNLYELAHKLSCVAHSWAQDPDSVDPVKHLKALRPDARSVLRREKDGGVDAGEAEGDES